MSQPVTDTRSIGRRAPRPLGRLPAERDERVVGRKGVGLHVGRALPMPHVRRTAQARSSLAVRSAAQPPPELAAAGVARARQNRLLCGPRFAVNSAPCGWSVRLP